MSLVKKKKTHVQVKTIVQLSNMHLNRLKTKKTHFTYIRLITFREMIYCLLRDILEHILLL